MIILHRPPNQKFLATSLGHAYLLQHPPKSQPNPYATYKRTCFDFVKIMDVSYGFHAFSRYRDGRLLERWTIKWFKWTTCLLFSCWMQVKWCYDWPIQTLFACFYDLKHKDQNLFQPQGLSERRIVNMWYSIKQILKKSFGCQNFSVRPFTSQIWIWSQKEILKTLSELKGLNRR